MDIPVDMSMGGVKLTRDRRKVCGTCKYHKHIYATVRQHHYDKVSVHDGWMCVNEDCEYCGCYTEYSDSCDDWEEK